MNWNLLRVACLAAALAVLSLADAVAYAASQPDVLPTGATITPDAAPGAIFQTLTVNLPDYPDREVDGEQMADNDYATALLIDKIAQSVCKKHSDLRHRR